MFLKVATRVPASTSGLLQHLLELVLTRTVSQNGSSGPTEFLVSERDDCEAIAVTLVGTCCRVRTPTLGSIPFINSGVEERSFAVGCSRRPPLQLHALHLC